MNKLLKLSFGGFTVGGIISSVVLGFGIRLAVAAIQDPLAALLIAFWNWKIVHAFAAANPIADLYVSWIVVGYAGVSSVVVLLVGYSVAKWVVGGNPSPR